MWIECYDYLHAERWFFWPILWGSLFCVAGIMLLIGARKGPEKRGCIMIGLSLWTAFALFWTIGVGYDVVSRYQRFKAILADQQYQETEGRVAHFNRYYSKKWRTHYDSFMVNQVRFNVKDKDLRGVPAAMDSSGHALANGRQVRVYYAGSVILKLWVKDSL